MTMTTKYIHLGLLVLAASQIGATDCGQVTRDDGFDLWCGEELCVWKIDRGEVGKVATWHEGDDGVELLGDDTAIYQRTPVTSDDGHCLRFELIADIDEGPEVRLLADVFSDGTIDFDERIPAADWRPIAFTFRVDDAYNGITFWITKSGGGRAVVAQLDAETIDCAGVGTAIRIDTAPLGGFCDVGDPVPDCGAGNFCTDGGTFTVEDVCSQCEWRLVDDVLEDSCTTAGEVCGLVDPSQANLEYYSACMPVGLKPIGARCAILFECEAGLRCMEGVCGTCDDAGGCPVGETCAKGTAFPDEFAEKVPWVCSPGLGYRATGEPCVTNADCASAVCVGEPLRVCRDGRPCGGPPDCPQVGLTYDACETLGVRGGTCQ
jgi:hypothetical protein